MLASSFVYVGLVIAAAGFVGLVKPIRRLGLATRLRALAIAAAGAALMAVGFLALADEAPRELVVGTVVDAPPGTRGRLTPQVFQRTLPPGFSLATMNFRVTPDGANGSLLTTETRVFANSPSARRRFSAYW